jgi:hypothetical protein
MCSTMFWTVDQITWSGGEGPKWVYEVKQQKEIEG